MRTAVRAARLRHRRNRSNSHAARRGWYSTAGWRSLGATMWRPTDLVEALMAEFPAPKEGIVLTHFIVSGDVERSRRFYTEVLGGETVLEGEPSIVALANGWVI